MKLACAASVSIGLSVGLKHFSLLSAGLMHFSLFEQAKIGASAKKRQKGEGKGKVEGNLVPPINVALAPIFCAAKKRKMPRTGRKTYGNACCVG